MKWILEWAKKALALYIRFDLAVLAILLLVHFVAKDRVIWTAAVYYGAPLPAMAGLCAVSVFLHRRRKARACLFALAMAGLALFWLIGSYRPPGDEPPQESDLTVLLWNVARPAVHPNGVLVDAIRREAPDIAGIIEWGEVSQIREEEYEAELPGYSCHLAPTGVGCLTRGRIIDVSECGTLHKFWCTRLSIDLEGSLYTVFLVDIGADIILSRATRTKALLEILDREPSERMVVMGDFNTPYGSVWLDPFRERFHHAFERAGSGFAETWPFRLPLLHIDHIWTSRDLLPVAMRKKYAFLSDHARMAVELRRAAAR